MVSQLKLNLNRMLINFFLGEILSAIFQGVMDLFSHVKSHFRLKASLEDENISLFPSD